MLEAFEVLPKDVHNRELLSHVHPENWVNPEPSGRYNLVVIGGGTAGLVSAAGAAGLGAKVALVEHHLMGGDCLNVGCVPSKSLIRSSHFKGEILRAEALGWKVSGNFEPDFGRVMERLRAIRSGLSRHDSFQRFKSLGVDVFQGDGRFLDSETIQVIPLCQGFGGQDVRKLKFKKAVIATGARAARPDIKGLGETGYLTNETVFNLTELPKRLAVIGGGPIGCELAQAFRRFGSEVTILDHGKQFLHREDPDAAEILRKTFEREGLRLFLNAKPVKVEKTSSGKLIHIETSGKKETVTVDEILVGAGRAPNVEGLNLEAAGVRYDTLRGVQVDDHLRTTNPRVFAAGDVCNAYKFTHTADAAARIVIQNALFKGRASISSLVVPWCTYTDPEIAHVGLYEREAGERGIGMDTFFQPFSDVDRAIAEGETDGFVKIHVKRGTDQILGATIVASHAGEMISEITTAMVGGVGLSKMASVIHPYPTQAEAIKKIADSYRRTKLTPWIKRAFQSWLKWTR